MLEIVAGATPRASTVQMPSGESPAIGDSPTISPRSRRSTTPRTPRGQSVARARSASKSEIGDREAIHPIEPRSANLASTWQEMSSILRSCPSPAVVARPRPGRPTRMEGRRREGRRREGLSLRPRTSCQRRRRHPAPEAHPSCFLSSRSIKHDPFHPRSVGGSARPVLGCRPNLTWHSIMMMDAPPRLDSIHLNTEPSPSRARTRLSNPIRRVDDLRGRSEERPATVRRRCSNGCLGARTPS